MACQWSRLLMFAKVILPAKCFHGKKEDGRSQAAAVKDNIKRWRNGEILSLWQEAKKGDVTKGKKRKKKKENEPTQDDLNAKRALKFVAEGQYSRASEALLSQGVAQVTSETLKIMKEKHPQAPVPQLIPHNDVEPLKPG